MPTTIPQVYQLLRIVVRDNGVMNSDTRFRGVNPSYRAAANVRQLAFSSLSRWAHRFKAPDALIGVHSEGPKRTSFRLNLPPPPLRKMQRHTASRLHHWGDGSNKTRANGLAYASIPSVHGSGDIDFTLASSPTVTIVRRATVDSARILQRDRRQQRSVASCSCLLHQSLGPRRPQRLSCHHPDRHRLAGF